MKSTRWIVACIAVGGFVGQSLAAPDIVRGVCASTPAAALLAAGGIGSANAPTLAEAHGYRVESVRWDPLLRQSWAVIESCDHPELPSIMRLIDRPAPVLHVAAQSYAAVMPIVRAGDLVRLWKSEPYAHIEMIAIAEESGAVGTRVRVRLANPRDGDGQITQPLYLAGIVRGPADVEMTP